MKIICMRWAIVGLFLSSISCSPMLKSLSEPKDGIYLIPKGYTGEVIILFDQPDGVGPEIEKGLFVYKIPNDGLLKINRKGYTGIVHLNYFYVEVDGRREQIKYLRGSGDRDPEGNPKDPFDGQIDKNQYENDIFVMGVGGIATTNSGGKNFSYTSFIVGSPKDIDRLHDKLDKRISSLHRELLGDN